MRNIKSDFHNNDELAFFKLAYLQTMSRTKQCFFAVFKCVSIAAITSAVLCANKWVIIATCFSKAILLRSRSSLYPIDSDNGKSMN
jgi:hypothetical protein